MPKLDRWIVASKMTQVLDSETIRKIIDTGGHIGGGWCEVHQHICVNKDNKEEIEELLRIKGFTVCSPADHRVHHPESKAYHPPCEEEEVEI